MGIDTDDWTRSFIPGAVPMTVLEIAAERGLAPPELLRRAGIEVALGDIFESGMTFADHAQLVRAVDDELGDPRLAFEIGWRLPPTALGNVGYALLSSATVAQALELLQRFWPLIGRASSIAVDTRGATGHVELAIRFPMTDEQRRMVTEVSLVSMARGVRALVPESADQTELWFDFPEPPQGAYVRERLGRVRYAMPAAQFRFPTELLERPLAMSNPVGLRAALKWCEREEKLRGLAEGRMTARVQAELEHTGEGYPSLATTARRLGVAPRTLRRHLSQEGTRYSDLLEAARRRDALRLLGNPRLTAAEVAEMLGYLDPANFTRAFRRWTGKTPTQYRGERRAADEEREG